MVDHTVMKATIARTRVQSDVINSEATEHLSSYVTAIPTLSSIFFGLSISFKNFLPFIFVAMPTQVRPRFGVPVDCLQLCIAEKFVESLLSSDAAVLKSAVGYIPEMRVRAINPNVTNVNLAR